MLSLSDLMIENSNISAQKSEEKKLSDDLQIKIHAAINKLNELQK